jgi:hypothetical protein
VRGDECYREERESYSKRKRDNTTFSFPLHLHKLPVDNTMTSVGADAVHDLGF